MISPCHSGNHTTAKISKGQLQFEDLPLVFRPAFLIRLRLLFIPRKRGQKTKRGAQEIRRLNLLSSNHVICPFRHFFIYHLHLLYINVFTVYSSKFSFLSFVFTMVFFFLFSSVRNLHNEAVTTTNSPPEKSGRVDLTGWTSSVSSVSFQVYLVANLRSVQNCPAN